ncbi:MAG: hypothetical protein ABWX76_12660, partial [Leifsonia flava]
MTSTATTEPAAAVLADPLEDAQPAERTPAATRSDAAPTRRGPRLAGMRQAAGNARTPFVWLRRIVSSRAVWLWTTVQPYLAVVSGLG